ncbi:MAG: UDP-N-acetylmuramate dehydrogenase [Sphingobacteriia bacterium]|nr:UDP-N-acetylmuramate dehydrogenase [Sphingobacteriia bacterium]
MTIFENHSLLPYNTFGIAAKARYFSPIGSLEQLDACISRNKKSFQLPLLILGGGSNLLFTQDFNGWVIKNEIKGIELVREDEGYYYIKAMAGENWHGLVMHCVAKNYAGLENLSLIPGNVGASPMQNIGAYGVEVKDVFFELEAYHIADRRVIKFSATDCSFGYRESVFKRALKNQFIILSVTYQLRKVPVFQTSYGAIEKELEAMHVTTPSVKAISDAVIRIRSSKLPDPAVIGNAGSFFKNPVIDVTQYDRLKKAFAGIPGYAQANTVKVPAGWLIEQCGWKGYRQGDAGCYNKQALVLVNYGHATGAEIFDLSSSIIQSVEQKFGILLEREVNII